jgi:RNA polymerase sigma factor (sigma-70 family)
LICRCLRRARQFVSHYARRHQLQQADAEDAEQDAVFWVLEAIRRYRTSEFVKAGGCHFRSFMRRVIASRLVDFSRQRQLWYHSPQGTAGAACTDPSRCVQEPIPPTFLEEEARVGLNQALARLSEADRRLWDLLVAGTPLRQTAATLGLSYDMAKRRRRKLLARLKCSLNPMSRAGHSPRRRPLSESAPRTPGPARQQR